MVELGRLQILRVEIGQGLRERFTLLGQGVE